MRIKFWVGDKRVKVTRVKGKRETLEPVYEILDLPPEKAVELAEVIFADIPPNMTGSLFLTNQAFVANIKSGEKISAQWVENWKREQHIKKQEERKKKLGK